MQIFQSINAAILELRNNTLRTVLSLFGVAIGVFCIVGVQTFFSSLENNIHESMATLGDDVLYVGKMPWMPENNEEYAWWKYKVRPPMNLQELDLLQNEARTVGYSAIMYTDESSEIIYNNARIHNCIIYAVSNDFNKLQNFDIAQGRYFSLQEMQSGLSRSIIIGHEVAENLFNSLSPLDKDIKLFGQQYHIIGVLKKQGKSISGFQFDRSAIMAYSSYISKFNIDKNSGNGFADPMLMLRLREGRNFDEMKFEVEGLLRAYRKLAPNEDKNFAFNQLSGIQEKVSEIFGKIKGIGWVVGFFSLLVGIFGVANIMFVSVKERTKQIGIKKSLGAKRFQILSEFLIEAIVICIIGGMFGLFLVYLLTLATQSSVDFPVKVTSDIILLGIIISTSVGVLAGIIPALQASKMNPVTAIRS